MTTFVYTLSSVASMFEWSFLSIRTLTKYVNPDEITVFFTPPRETTHVERLKYLNINVRCVENSTDSFTAFNKERHYGEKTWLTDVDDDTVVFLDCDTLVFDDIESVTIGDFDFKARPGSAQVYQEEWRELFDQFDEPYLNWMPNTGFMVFKNGIHKEIEEDWRRYLGTEIDYQHGVNHKEQYALSLAVSGYDIEKMMVSEHAMMWDAEFPSDAIVYHAGKSLEPEFGMPPDSFKGNLYVGIQKLLEGKI